MLSENERLKKAVCIVEFSALLLAELSTLLENNFTIFSLGYFECQDLAFDLKKRKERVSSLHFSECKPGKKNA